MPGDSYDFLVSVITPTYNSKLNLKRVVCSVKSQTVKVLEHIIIDDGSTDGTLDYLNDIGFKNPHLTIISQENLGAGVARNKGIAVAKGKYIVFLDSDDFWHKDKLKSQISFMENRGVLFSYGDYSEIEEGSNKLISIRYTPAKLKYDDLLVGCPIGCLTAGYNQIALGKIFMPSVRRGQDWGLWLAITRKKIIAYRYPGNYADYYISLNSLSRNKCKKALDVFEIYFRFENLGFFKSFYYLIRHSLNALVKNKK